MWPLFSIFGGIDFRANHLLIKCVQYYKVIPVGRQPDGRPQDSEDEKVSLVNSFRIGPSAGGTVTRVRNASSRLKDDRS